MIYEKNKMEKKNPPVQYSHDKLMIGFLGKYKNKEQMLCTPWWFTWLKYFLRTNSSTNRRKLNLK